MVGSLTGGAAVGVPLFIAISVIAFGHHLVVVK